MKIIIGNLYNNWTIKSHSRGKLRLTISTKLITTSNRYVLGLSNHKKESHDNRNWANGNRPHEAFSNVAFFNLKIISRISDNGEVVTKIK